MEQAQSSAPPVQASSLPDEELKTPVVDAPAPIVATCHQESKVPETDVPAPVAATSHQEESKAPEADMPAPVVPAPHDEEPDVPRAETPGTEQGPNEHDHVEIVRASPT
jgi:hypothetical protein